jgi:hypothetical protein
LLLARLGVASTQLSLKESQSSPSLPGIKGTKHPRTLESPHTEALAPALTKDLLETSHSSKVSQYDAFVLVTWCLRWHHWLKLSTDSVAWLALKESWPDSNHAMLETNMFTDVQGSHDIPVIIGFVNSPNTLNVFTGLRDLGLCGDFKEVHSDRGKHPETVCQALVRMICGTQGMSLGQLAHEPKMRLKAILDTMMRRILGNLMMVHVLVAWL